MKIPYGISDFGQIRAEGFFYTDKTPFLPVLESAELGYRHLLFLRPRRFGKSTLLSLLEHYYDIDKKEQFDALFQGLWIHEHPTAERNSYLVLTLDFSRVITDAGPEALRRTFFYAVRSRVKSFLLQHRDRIPPLGDIYDALDQHQDADALIGEVMDVVSVTEYKLYILIDEYDHFANRLLAAGQQDLYRSAIEGSGFVRTFYATLKSGTGSGAVGRMFITGITPIMLNDLSSGFNIVTPISMSRRFNTLAGFTREDVERAIHEFVAARPEVANQPEIGDPGRLLDTLSAYYDGYRFSPDAPSRVFNADMVLYFFRELSDKGRHPTEMLDLNVRTDYAELRRLGLFSGALGAARRALLEAIVSDGWVQSNLVEQFGWKTREQEQQFISLLYYLGMLTIGEAAPSSNRLRLSIPNRVILELHWEHIAEALEDEARVHVEINALESTLEAMAIQGDIASFLSLFQERVIQRIGVKDTRRFDEKSLKLMLLAFISLSRIFYPLSEKEFSQGYCDLFLGASKNVAGARYSWLLEFKYLQANAKPAQIEAAFAEAEAQVERYSSDKALLPLLLGNRELKAGMIVFVGIKKVLFRPWPPAQSAKPRAARGAGARAGRRRGR